MTAAPRPLAFPGAIYDARGRNLDSAVPDLRQEDLDVHPHRFLVTDRNAAPVARMWVLADDAVTAAIHPPSRMECSTVDHRPELVLAGVQDHVVEAADQAGLVLAQGDRLGPIALGAPQLLRDTQELREEQA